MNRCALILLYATFLLLLGCSSGGDNSPLTTHQMPDLASLEMEESFSGLQYFDVETGDGDHPYPGAEVVVHYAGWSTDGRMFDNSTQREDPFRFTIGEGNVIPGWDEGILPMRVGGKRILVVPPELGYGNIGVPGKVPPNATLIFYIELLEIR